MSDIPPLTHPELEAAIKHVTAFDDAQVGMLEYGQLWRLITAARHYIWMLAEMERLQTAQQAVLDQAAWAADEIKRLREALREIAELNSVGGDAAYMMDVARRALVQP